MIMKTTDKFIAALGLITIMAMSLFMWIYIIDARIDARIENCTNEAWRWYDSVKQYEKKTWCDFSATGLIDNK